MIVEELTITTTPTSIWALLPDATYSSLVEPVKIVLRTIEGETANVKISTSQTDTAPTILNNAVALHTEVVLETKDLTKVLLSATASTTVGCLIFCKE